MAKHHSTSITTKGTRWTRKRLIALGLPAVLIPGILIAMALGWNPTKLASVKNYQEIKTIFPSSGIVTHVVDGDTFELKNGVGVRMIGIDAPNRGEAKWDEARVALDELIDRKRVYLEYDRYQDDKYGRILAWIWVGCEREPSFLPADYMHLTYNSSREGLLENPKGCSEGKLVNEEMVRKGLASDEKYKERGTLKYEGRMGINITNNPIIQ
ncbi:MAG: thermonuclease family protein [Candidatus Gottesmanbacteria bacterium]|nr:thermonuclease family protein [Candidatus Gottesmanbacteria bacterium]